MIAKSLEDYQMGKGRVKTPVLGAEFYGCMQNKGVLSCVCVLLAVFCALKRQAATLTFGKDKKT